MPKKFRTISWCKWLLYFFGPPCAIAYFFLGPIVSLKKIEITDNRINFSESETRTPRKQVLENIYGRSILNLGIYLFYLQNKNRIYLNDIEIKLPFEKDLETGAMEVVIDTGHTPLYTKAGDHDVTFATFEPSEASYNFRLPTPDLVPIIAREVKSEVDLDETQLLLALRKDAYVDTQKSSFIALQFPIVGYFLIFLAWLNFWSVLIWSLTRCNKKTPLST